MSGRRFGMVVLVAVAAMLLGMGVGGCEPAPGPTCPAVEVTVACVFPTPEVTATPAATATPTVTPAPTATPPATPSPWATPEVWDARQQPAVQRDWDWLRENFGDVTVTHSPGPVSEEVGYAHLARIDVTEGPAVLTVHVQDEEGQPIEHTPVLFWWPDAPAHPEGGCWDMYEEETGGRFVHEWTNGEGDAGFGLGQGSYYDPAAGESGLHQIWMCWYYSDLVQNLGMVWGTPHAGPLHLTYVVEGERDGSYPGQ